MVLRAASGSNVPGRFGPRAIFNGTGGSGTAPFDIFLTIGQSNMSGRGTISGIDTGSPNVFQYGGYSADSSTYQKIGAAIDPLKYPDFVSVGVGPAMSFAKAHYARTGKNVLLVPAAVGSTVLTPINPLISGNTQSTWSPYGSNNGSLTFAISQANAAITLAQAQYPGSSFAGILWCQGEGDGANGTIQVAYQQTLYDFILYCRANVTGASSAPFIIGRMLPEAISANVANSVTPATYPGIDSAHTVIGAAVPLTTVITTVGTGFSQGDNLHINDAGQNIQGPKYDTAIATALANTGEATPGQVVGLATGTATPTSMPLTWTATAGARSYTVQYSSDSGVTWSTVIGPITNTSTTTNSVTVTGLTASTSYQFKVRANSYGAVPSGTFSSVATASTAAPLADAFVQMTAIVGSHITQSGSAGTGWSYTSTTGTTFAADQVGTSSLKMPAGVDGALRASISTNASIINWILGLVTTQSNPLYSAGASGYKFGLISANTGNYKVIVDGGSGTVTPNGNAAFAVQAGDIMQLSRAGTTIIAQVARSASPTTFTTIHTFVATSGADLWGALTGNGNASVIGPIIGNGWA